MTALPRIRQLVIAASELEPAEKLLCHVLGTGVAYRDPGVAHFGLHNILLAFGDTFLEVVSPLPDQEPLSTPAGRHIQRCGGDCGYMVLVQEEDFAEVDARLTKLDVRRVWETDREEFGVQVKAVHIHPASLPGAIVSLDQMQPATEWCWGGAGDGWRATVKPDADCLQLTGCTLVSAEAESLSERWAEVLGGTSDPSSEELTVAEVRQSDTFIRFHSGGVDWPDVSGSVSHRIGAFHIQVRDQQSLQRILERAVSSGLAVGSDNFTALGVRFVLHT